MVRKLLYGLAKKKHTWWNAYKYIKDNECIIFSWENLKAASNDRDRFYKSRY